VIGGSPPFFLRSRASVVDFETVVYMKWIHPVVGMLAMIMATSRTYAVPTHRVDENPISIVKDSSGVIIVDFGRVAFGNIRLMPPPCAMGSNVVHFGESFVDGRINRKPSGAVRYSKTSITLEGENAIVVAPPADARNTGLTAILTPPEWGVVLPFRWVLDQPVNGTVNFEVRKK
jgi:hypothetical protein